MRVLVEGLIDLGLLKGSIDSIIEQAHYRHLYMHRTGHWLGLDVHDVGSFDWPMKEGMVFTCEPGIYILEEKLGIRLENDILIQKSGNIDLMQEIPIAVEEIEDMLNI